MDKDLPRSTVMLLAILVILVSIIGTWSFMAKLAPEPKAQINNQGVIQIDIQPPESTGRTVQTSGNIALEIVPEE